MSAIMTVFVRDLGRLVHSGVVVILIVLFLIMMGAMFFTDFFQSVQTLSLRQFFSQAPLLLSIFCPALTMGVISEERRRGTLALLETMPVSIVQLVTAKFLAVMALLGAVLFFTLSYPISLAQLGDLDWGPVIGGYIALMMLGGVYAAIGLFASACARDQVSSFLLAFFLCFVLTFIHRLAEDASGTAASFLQAISISVHFQNIARGVVDIRDIIYALSLQFFALTSAVLLLEAHRYPQKTLESDK